MPTTIEEPQSGDFGREFDAFPVWTPGPSLPVKRGVAGTIGSSFARGTDQLQATGFGLAAVIADTFGADQFAKSFLRDYTRNVAEAGQNPAEVGTFRNIEDIGDAVTYAIEGLFENLPNIGASVVSGGVGAAGSRFVAGRAVAAKLAERQLGVEAAKRFSEATLARGAARVASGAAATGAVVGGSLANIGQETGSIAGDIYERTGEMDPAHAFAGGVLAGGLETVADARWLRQVFGRAQAAKLEDTFKAKAGRVFGSAVKQSQIEGFTEGVQTVIEDASAWHAENQPDKPFWTPALRDAIVDSYLKSLLPGGVMGGGGQIMEDVNRRERVAGLRAVAQQNRDVGNLETAKRVDQQADEEEFKPATAEELKRPATTVNAAGKTVVVNQETGGTAFDPTSVESVPDVQTLSKGASNDVAGQAKPISPTASAPTPAASAPAAGAPAPVADVPLAGESPIQDKVKRLLAGESVVVSIEDMEKLESRVDSVPELRRIVTVPNLKQVGTKDVYLASLKPISPPSAAPARKPKSSVEPDTNARVQVDPQTDELLGTNERGEPIYWSAASKTHYAVSKGRVVTGPWTAGLPESATQRLDHLIEASQSQTPEPAPPPSTEMVEVETDPNAKLPDLEEPAPMVEQEKPQVLFTQGQRVRSGNIVGNLAIYDDGRLAIRTDTGSEFPVVVRNVVAEPSPPPSAPADVGAGATSPRTGSLTPAEQVELNELRITKENRGGKLGSLNSERLAELEAKAGPEIIAPAAGQSKATPDRTRRINIQQDAATVVFPDANHTSLFAIQSRFRKLTSGKGSPDDAANLQQTIDWLKAVFGFKDQSELVKSADAYRRLVTDMAKSKIASNTGKTEPKFEAPRFERPASAAPPVTTPDAEVPATTPAPSTAKLTDNKSNPLSKLTAAEQAEMADLESQMRELLKQVGSAPDPQILIVGSKMAKLHIKSGVRRFADFAAKMKAQFPGMWYKLKDRLKLFWDDAALEHPDIDEASRAESARIVADLTAAEVDGVATAATPTVGNPDEQAIQQIEAALKAGSVTRGQVNDIISRTHGGTLASGAVDAKQLTDLVEAAINRIILADPERYGVRPGADSAQDVVVRLKLLVANAPTQTTRTEEQNKMQQFSTPPFLGYVANWVANITSADVVLEPSAGIGGLAVFAKSQGAAVIGNELSERRAALLKLTGSTSHVRTVNAEQLHARLAPEIAIGALPQPTVVVMNPPFSNAANTSQSNTLVGAKHVEQALELLPPGGRLVAIVGEGMADDRPRFKNWWAQTKRKYNVRANIGISGDEYRKYGTTFGNNLLVIDKTGPTPEGKTTTGSVVKVEDLIPLLEGIKNDRRRIEPKTAQPGGGAATGTGTGDARPGLAPPVATGSPGTRRGGRGKPASSPSGGTQQPGSQGDNAAVGVGNRTDTGGSNQPATAAVERHGAPRSYAGPAKGLKVETRDDGKEVTLVGTDGVFAVYQPAKLKIEGAKPHPTELVESASMASTPPVDPNYRPSIPQSAITNGDLSEAQIEQVVYAGQAHEQMLPSGERQGYFVGDGTGVGKGRIISGVFLDNWNQGRKKGVWVSKTKNLINDAKRDLGALGLNPDVVLDMAKKPVIPPQSQDGIAFLTYKGLSMNNPGIGKEGVLEKSAKPNRMKGLLDWLGADFDGVIALDEVHMAGSAVSVKGTFGSKDASQRALAVVDLQRLFPKARILYVSATGATDITNLGYGDRLGIWGAGKPFATKQDFFTKIAAGGISAMEIVARDLKALGSYLARTLSFRGVEQEQVVHALTPEQRTMYDEIAAAWQMVFANVDTAMGDSGANNNSQARSRAMGAFWGAEQRFFNQLLTALQMPSVLAEVRKDLEAGRSAVLQVVNTNEATLKRELADQDEESPALEDLDLTPKDILLSYVDKSFPTSLYEPKEDADGNVRYVPVLDDKGNPVQDPKAVALKNETLAKLSLLKVPTNPMEQLLDTFGADAVAEVTGRTKRVVWGKDENGRKVRVKEDRNEARRKVETDEFNAGKRRVLVFSDAGGTGFSYHAGVKFKNQERRAHYVIQAGWRADAALQGMGRTHRSDQVTPPIYKLVSTDLKGHQRFISTIARRLNQLGALVSGERKSAGSGMFSEEQNLENDYAQSALDGMFVEAWRGKLTGVKFNELARSLGFVRTRVDPQTGEKVTEITLIDPKTGGLNFDKLPDVPQFLNRILALPVDQQNHVFNLFMERLQSKVEIAKQQGTYDPGTQQRHALAIRVTKEETAYTHPSGATTKLVDVDVDEAVKRASWQDVSKLTVQQFVRNKKSGHIYGLIEGPNITDDKGAVSSTWRRIGVRGHTLAKQSEVKVGPSEWHNYEAISKQEVEPLWNQDFAKTPDRSTTQETYIVGAFLPIWDRIGLSRPRIYRLNTDKGNFLGAQVPEDMVSEVRRRLGASQSALTATDLFRGLSNGERFEFANGWTLKRSKVLNEWRIEAIGVEYAQRREWNNFIGGYTEQIQWQERFFLPNDETQATAALGKILEKTPVLQDSDAPTSDSALAAIDRLQKGLDGKTYSDPLLLTPLAKLALQLAKALLRAGRTLEVAIREAIAQAKAQMPGEVVDEAQLTAAMREGVFAVAPEAAPQAAPYTGETKESKAMPALEPIQYRATTNAEAEAHAADFIDRVHGGDMTAALRAAMLPDPLSGIDDRMRIFIGGTITKRAAARWREGDASMQAVAAEAAKWLQQLTLSGAGQTLQAGNWAKNNVLSSSAIMDLLGRVNDPIDASLKLKFPDVDSDRIRAWLLSSGRKAVAGLAELMAHTNNVSGRVLRIVGRDSGINWHDLFTSAEVNQRAVQQDLFAKIREHPKLQNLSEAEAVELTNILTEAWMKERRKVFLTEFRKEVAMPNVKATDKAKLESALPELLKQLNLGLLANEAFRHALAPKYGLKPITDAQAKALYDKAQEAQAKPEGWQRNEALREVINEMVRLSGISRTEMLKSWWYASVLSGLGTQGRNIVGNAGVLMENFVASVARNPRAAGSLVGGLLRGMRENATQGEFKAIMQGRMAARPGMDIEGAANTLELLKDSPERWQRMLATGRYVTRFMLATDSFFYDANAEVAAINAIVSQNRGATWANVESQIFEQLNLSPEKRAAAEAKAKAEGLSGSDLKRRVVEILEQTRPSEIVEAQHRFALEATMNNEPQGFLGHIATGLMAAREAFPPLTAVVPFIRISANVGNMLLQHSPAGLYWVLRNWRTEGQNWKDGKTGAWSGYAIGVRPDMTPEEYQQLRAKVLLSHAALMMTLAWAMSGADEDDPWFQVTGSMQGIDPDKRRQLEEQGIRPYSVKFGDRSFDYRLTPWAFALANVGQVMDGKRYDPKWDEHGAMVKFATAAAGGKFVIMDQSFLSNLMVWAERGPQMAKDQNANKYLAMFARTTGGLIPTLVKEGDSWFEPEVRKAQPGWDYFQREVPFIRRNVGTPVVNVLGEPVERPRYPWSWLTSEASNDPVWQALGEKAQKGVFLPVPSAAATVLANGKRVKMTPEQFAKYQAEVGKLYKAKLTRDLVRLQRMTPEQASDYFKREFEPLREQARMRVR